VLPTGFRELAFPWMLMLMLMLMLWQRPAQT
jgi:hypothetical protein